MKEPVAATARLRQLVRLGPVAVPDAERRVKGPLRDSVHFAQPGHVAVIGGGIAGLAAATVLAERGVRVTLLERELFLGGRAGSWGDRLRDGTPFEMERGFHAFFRQYYNLRALLRRVDPGLSKLKPLDDYPLLAPNGVRESFTNLPKLPPFNVAALVRRTDALSLRDLTRVNALSALEMLRFDDARTYRKHDTQTAADYLDSLRFPGAARQRLFDVFSHSFFNPEGEYSAAELLMNFHFYFMGNPEGLVFDVATEPFGSAFWSPLGERLRSLGADVRLGAAVSSVERHEGGFRVEVEGRNAAQNAREKALDADALVLAVDVPGVHSLMESSPSLGSARLRKRLAALEVTRPFVVWRLWLSKPVRRDRSAFAGTTGEGILDNISVYERLEGESEAWAARTGGSVVELHAYAVPPELSERAVREDMLRGLHAFYPETAEATILEERYLVRRDCPGFRPGSNAERPGVETDDPALVLAGDYVRTEFPCALMEKAAATGFRAANRLLAEGAAHEPLFSVPPRGLLAGRGARTLER